jgi:hypothetical protein
MKNTVPENATKTEVTENRKNRFKSGSKICGMPILVICLRWTTLFFCGCTKKKHYPLLSEDEWVITAPVCPQAEPVRNWLQSIKARDVELFKTVFSSRIASIMEQQGWGTSLGVYTLLWTDKLGDYDIAELTFHFTPDGHTIPSCSGQVTVIKGSTELPPVKVILEDGVWKVDER